MAADGAPMPRRAVFFDRDGTLNVDTAYLFRTEDFRWTEDAPEAVRFANERGFLVIVVTNQSGVARGYFGEADVRRLHGWMNDDLARTGAHIDAFYYCPHLPGAAVAAYDVDCDCRKPKPGLVDRACADFGVDRAASLLIGDAPRDLACAAAAGVRGVRYEGGSLLALLRREIG